MMNASRPWVCLSLWLLVPALACAEPPAKGPPAQMGEDIEVMRRLLLREVRSRQMACGSCHKHAVASQAKDQRGWSAAFSPDGRYLATQQDGVVRLWDPATGKAVLPPNHPAITSRPSDVEGVYLEGYGVVFTLALPPQPPRAKKAAKPAGKPVSDWDRVRKEVRGEKDAGPAAAAEPHEPDIADALLHLLAENGHHFTRLDKAEYLTFAVTFRAGEASADAAGKSLAERRLAYAQFLEKGGHAEAARILRGQSATAKHGGPAKGPSGKPAATTSVDYELIGDLQLRQGRVQEAVAAYQRALELKPDDNRLRTVQQKIGQAYLRLSQGSVVGGGVSEEQAVDNAIRFLRERLGNDPNRNTDLAAIIDTLSRAKAGVAPSAEHAVPTQLVITARRDTLDQVGSGKITFEEFRRRVTVQHRPDEKKAAGGESPAAD
jgi:tetratricopeptide (TPR) repeat protein